MLKIFENAKKDKSFGNGRFARKLLEKAKMKQAKRLLKCDLKFVSDKEITTLVAEDFETVTAKPQISAKIGFSI